MPDTLAPIRSVDSADQLSDVMALPEHLRDALWRVESAGLEPCDSPGGVLVCGMGGSAVGGDLAAAVLGDRASRAVTTVRGYGLPAWASTDSVVLCASYSGNTEETLGCYSTAEALGARRVVVTTGGALGEAARRDSVPVIGIPAALQPRAAVAYMFVAAAEVAGLAGAAPRLHTEIDVAAEWIGERMEAIADRAAQVAARLAGSVAVVYGNDLTTPIAYRWKTQINENGKVPAFTHELPEMDHNEIVGWEGAPELGRFAAVFLEDRDQHPRVRRRMELTAELIEPGASEVIRIETEGESRTERMLWAVLLGDLISLHVAAQRGVDPSPVPVIENLKDQLGRP